MALITAQARNEMIALHLAMFNTGPSQDVLNQIVAHLEAGGTAQQVANALALQPGYGLAGKTAPEVAAYIVSTLLTPATPAAGVTYATDWIIASLNAGVSREQVALEAVRALQATNEPAYADAKAQLAADIAAVLAGPGQSFGIEDGLVGTANIMRLTGDQDVRIDFTVNDHQVRGLDLDGDGVIENNGIENVNPTGLDNGKDYEVVDAYSRNPFNQLDSRNNFLGDIEFDGTGFSGDGVSTNGNIFLGGLGIDTAFGGIGNDFLTGGGVAESREGEGRGDTLSGGRNADFFFVELSALDPTDGNNLAIDGGTTSDDSAAGTIQTAQDSDWLLFEGSDDDEPVTILLRDDSLLDAPDLNHDGVTGIVFVDHDGDEANDNVNNPVTLVNTPRVAVVSDAYLESTTGESGSIVSRSGQTVGVLRDIENFDASGNLYGFLDGINVSLGGKTAPYVAGQGNNGIGSSAQLNIVGSDVRNILVGGYDNDTISGNKGDDLLMGGNLNFLINPNLLDIVDNGMDEMWGGDGEDDIVFEADGGTIDGGSGDDTLWLTREAFGRQTSALAEDNTLRFDLEADNLDASSGYGGADATDGRVGGFGSQDQTNYVEEGKRVDITSMESVIATGLGSVDYLAAGSNDPELLFAYQQNHFALGDVNLDLRGNDSTNTLYADAGDDIIEGRRGDDYLSGGEGNDDFIFALGGRSGEDYGEDGDGVDVIHRQADANNDNIWDMDDEDNVLYSQDFGVNSSSEFGPSTLTVDFSQANLASANVSTSSFSVNIGGVTFAVTDMAALAAASTTAELAALANTAFQAIDPNVTVTADGDIITITDSTPAGGRLISDTGPEGYAVSIAVVAPGTGTLVLPVYTAPGESVSEDRLLYVAYEDEDDGEYVNDASTTGSSISLGSRAYAEDLVIDFAAADYDMDGDGEVDVDTAGTRIAESQEYWVYFDNLTTQDVVSINVNGVTYSLEVGTDIDGLDIANEMLGGQGGTASSQSEIQSNFLARMEQFINSFMDDDTAAGQVGAIGYSNALVLIQQAYDGEETVFMRSPIVTVGNASGGQPATVTIVNNAAHEVQLLDFDGRDGNLNRDNVLFIGDTEISRAILETASDTLAAGTTFNTLNGSEALVIDGGTDSMQGTVTTTGATIFNNTATNSNLRVDFTVHGDDFLIGGAVSDHISGGTGDDRVIGSRGNDVLDGGKSFYKVKVLGETLPRVYVLNQWEAEHPTLVAALAGLTITSIDNIEDTESGNGISLLAPTEEVYRDTLQYNQNDFTPGATRFTVTLDNFTLVGTEVQLRNGGAGTVGVDVDGNGTIESTSTFTNFENIRTISGTGNAVAGGGQGNDTLNVVAMSNVTTGAGGISYDLTNGGSAGQVRYSTDAILTTPVGTDRPQISDYDALVIKVDGVENVVTGSGADLLVIDESEAAKNNSFSAGTSVDRIIYTNNYNIDVDAVGLGLDLDHDGDSDITDEAIADDLASDRPEATVTVKVTGVGSSTVAMTGGRVGSTLATDTLTGVEYISLDANTAEGMAEADVLDLTSFVGGASFNYTTGVVASGGVTQVTIDVGATEIENVWGDGNDTVFIANTMTNARSDELNANDTPPEEIEFMTFFDYDDLNDDGGRLAFGTDGDAVMHVINQNQYTFDLSRVGDEADSDTVDYKAETGNIIAVVNFDTALNKQYIMVDSDGSGVAESSFADLVDPTFLYTNSTGSRVDQLIEVENVVASQGESVLDLTGANQNLRITFSADFDRVGDYNAAYAAGNGLEIHQIAVTGATVGAPNLINMNYLDYVFVDTTPLNPVGDPVLQPSVYWNRIEGSDFNETVELSGWEADETHTLNLRGGANQVNYEGDSVEIVINIVAFDEDNATTTGLIEVEALHTAPGDDHNDATVDADVSGTDFITSYSAQNTVSGVANRLTIKGARGDLDTVAFAGGLNDVNKFFILGGVTDATSSITVVIGEADDANSIELVGFETLQDADSDDVYDMADLEQVQDDLSFIDNGVDDYDTIKVRDDAIDFDGGPIQLDTNAADTISLEVLNDVFGFDFDVLDVTAVTDGDLILIADDDDQDNDLTLNSADADYVGPGDTDANGANDVARDLDDDVIVGNLNLIDSVSGFRTIFFTNASITSSGTSFVLDVTGGELEEGDGDVLFDLDSASMDFSKVTGSNLTLTAVSALGVSIVGSAGNDTITGSAGSDYIEGGAGNDTLDGGISQEVRTIELSGILDGTVDAAAVTLTLGTGGLVMTLNESAAPADVTATDGSLDILAGSGSDAVGAALATLVNANLTAINAVPGAFTDGTDDIDLLSASYDSATNLLTFKFATGSDVLLTDAIVLTSNDTGVSFVGSADTTTSEGGDGGADIFAFSGPSLKNDPADGVANGLDTINGFQVGQDLLNLDQLGITSVTAVAANTDAGMTGQGLYVFADGADGFGASAITSYTNTTQVAAFLATNFSGEVLFDVDTGDGWVVAVINDLLTTTSYVYDVYVGGTVLAPAIGASSINLIGIVNADAALTIAEIA